MTGTDDEETGGLDRREEQDPIRVQTRLAVVQALGAGEFGDVCVLTHEEVDQVLTPTAREILRTLDRTQVDSVHELAQKLESDPETIKAELETLGADGLISYDTEGNAKRPVLEYDTVIVEPIVAESDALPISQLDEEPDIPVIF